MSIVLEKICRSYEGHAVLKDFSYVFPNRGRYAFFGPSGCGKTTLMRIIGGLEKPDSGVRKAEPSLRFSWMFQENRLLPWYTVEKNLTFITGDPSISREWLEKIRLPETAGLYPDQLSGGMRRRVSLARALAAESDVLMLDEPFKELDMESADSMIRLVDRYAENRLLLLVTHQLSDLEQLRCEKISLPQ